jgi:hypothetical protein
MDDMDMDMDMDVDGNENEVMNMRVASQIQEVLQRLEENMTNTFPKDIEDFYDTALRYIINNASRFTSYSTRPFWLISIYL